MFNVLRNMPQVTKIAQVAVRDFSKFGGLGRLGPPGASPRSTTLSRPASETWDAQCRRIVDALPQEVYVSFDINALTFKTALTPEHQFPAALRSNQARVGCSIRSPARDAVSSVSTWWRVCPTPTSG